VQLSNVNTDQTVQHDKLSLLTPIQMDRADRAAEASGVDGFGLMEAAGSAVAVAVAVGARWAMRSVTVLSGPGNNGGDGFVAARHLVAAGWPGKLALLGSRENLTGEAAHAASLWESDVAPLSAESLDGAGLSRPLDGNALAVVEALGARRIPTCAVDVPSGLDGASGMIRGPLRRPTLR